MPSNNDLVSAVWYIHNCVVLLLPLHQKLGYKESLKPSLVSCY